MEDRRFELHLWRPVRVFCWKREASFEETTYASKLVSILPTYRSVSLGGIVFATAPAEELTNPNRTKP